MQIKLDKLHKLVSPPKRPIRPGAPDKWKSIEKKLKIEFPDDLYLVSHSYGSGGFFRGSFVISNPFGADFKFELSDALDHAKDMKDTFPDEFPFDIYPIDGGLLPLGYDDNGSEFYWRTVGVPNEWPIVCRSEDFEWVTVEECLVQFLIMIFENKLVLPFWGESTEDDLEFRSRTI